MFKFRLMIEDLAEKVLGQLIPTEEAKAWGCAWEYAGCCGSQKKTRFVCDGVYMGQTKCEGYCPG